MKANERTFFSLITYLNCLSIIHYRLPYIAIIRRHSSQALPAEGC